MSEATSELARLRAELAATKTELARSEAVVSASEAIISGLSPPAGGNIRKGKSAKEISPIAFEAVKRIDAVFAIEREIRCARVGRRRALAKGP